MSTFNFICPHCSYSQQLAAKADGLHGKCPSCDENVIVQATKVPNRPIEVASYWYVLSSGLDAETPERLTEPQIVELINAERIGSGADVLKPGSSQNEWVKLKDTHLNAYVEHVRERKQLAMEERKSDAVAKREAKKSARSEQQARNEQEKTEFRENRAREAEQKRRDAEENRQQQAVLKAQNQPQTPKNKKRSATIGIALIIVVVLAALAAVDFATDGEYTAGINPFGPKVTRVTVQAGDAVITDREDTGLSHLKLTCNNGLVINCDWKRNSYNDFGYDIYEPSISRDYNRLAVMMLARGVIANYLKGKYD
jgi:hypothetical protein